MDIRESIRYLMQTQGMSIRELACRSGVRRLSIMHFLNGANIHTDNLQKLIKTLGYSFTLTPCNQMEPKIKLDNKAIARFCKKYHVRLLALFGSVLRDDFTKDSDIDILVDFERPIGFFEMADFEGALKRAIRTSHPLDVVTIGALSPLIAGDIINSSEVVYAKAA